MQTFRKTWFSSFCWVLSSCPTQTHGCWSLVSWKTVGFQLRCWDGYKELWGGCGVRHAAWPWHVSGGRYLGSAERCRGDRAPDEGNLREEGFLWVHGFKGAIRVVWRGRQGFWETLCDGSLSQLAPILVDQEAESPGQYQSGNKANPRRTLLPY